MKTFITFLLGITFSITFAQNTTEEEYNWMVSGYKNMIKDGNDMKKGYSFIETREYSESRGDYSFTYKFLQRDKDKALAGVVLVMKIASTGKVNYYGIPLGEWSEGKYNPSELMPKFEAEIKPLSWGSYYALTGTLANLFASLSVTKAKTNVAQPSKESRFNGKYIDEFGNSITITGPAKDGAVQFSLMVTTAKGCVGELSGTAYLIKDNMAQWYENPKESKAQINLIFHEETGYIEVQEYDCQSYHGAGCGFAGAYKRKK